jgi:hypothetical protein
MARKKQVSELREDGVKTTNDAENVDVEEHAKRATIRVLPVNPSVRIDGKVIVYKEGEPNNARLVPANLIRPPFNKPTEIHEQIFTAGKAPDDFGSLVVKLLPTTAQINHAFWGARVVFKGDLRRTTWVRNAVMRALPSVQQVVAILRNTK